MRHIGIYAYRAGFINTYVNWAPSALEQIECLEQLRVLWYGEKIHVAVAKDLSNEQQNPKLRLGKHLVYSRFVWLF